MNGSAFAPKIFSGSGRASPTNLRCSCIVFAGIVGGTAGVEVDEFPLPGMGVTDVMVFGGFPAPDIDVLRACEASLQAKVASIMTANPINRKSRDEDESCFIIAHSL